MLRSFHRAPRELDPWRQLVSGRRSSAARHQQQRLPLSDAQITARTPPSTATIPNCTLRSLVFDCAGNTRASALTGAAASTLSCENIERTTTTTSEAPARDRGRRPRRLPLERRRARAALRVDAEHGYARCPDCTAPVDVVSVDALLSARAFHRECRVQHRRDGLLDGWRRGRRERGLCYWSSWRRRDLRVVVLR